MHLSVIICTRNPNNKYFRSVLESLRAQSLPLNDWELLVVDNNSDIPLNQDWDLSWHPNHLHIRENRTGLTFARTAGIKKSSGSILVFVDDDNVLNSNYLNIALCLSESWPQLGAWGGSYYPVYEEDPPADSKKWVFGLVVDSVESVQWTTIKQYSYGRPSGAGLCIRKDVGEHYVELVEKSKLREMLDRSGKHFLAGGDTDICFIALEMGYTMGRFPELGLHHLIAKNRTGLSYFRKIFYGFAFSNEIISHLHGIPSCMSITGNIQKIRQIVSSVLKLHFWDALIQMSEYQGTMSGRRILRKFQKQEMTVF